MPKVRKAELSFLYATRRLILFYISTKYHQNIFEGYSSYRADKKFYPHTDTHADANGIRPPPAPPPPPPPPPKKKNNMSPYPSVGTNGHSSIQSIHFCLDSK